MSVMETNSEKMAMWIGIGTAVLGAVGAVLDALVKGGVFQEGSAGYVVAGAIVLVIGTIMTYMKGRSAIKANAALSSGLLPSQLLSGTKPSDPPQPPSQS